MAKGSLKLCVRVTGRIPESYQEKRAWGSNTHSLGEAKPALGADRLLTLRVFADLESDPYLSTYNGPLV